MPGNSDFGADEASVQGYFREGGKRALALVNRGPVRLTDSGELHPEIVESYLRTGFYIFERVIDPQELVELREELLALIDRLPTTRGGKLDRMGGPALGADRDSPMISWSRPLGDPMGGTSAARGRAPVKMFEPKPAEGLPDEIPYMIHGPLQYSDAALRIYGHPALLAIAATINGADFAPFNEVLIFKKPGEGASFAWHQDGTTHWESPDWSPLIHGFNFMVQLFPCTPANAVWYVPGSHASGKADIRALVEQAGGNCLPEAVPLICKPGDVAISNRQIVHGSFPNTSDDWRMTLNIGFHQRRAVEDVETIDLKGARRHFAAEQVRKRAEVLGYAIDARRQRYPNETPFDYAPHASASSFHWNDDARNVIRDYQRMDLLI